MAKSEVYSWRISSRMKRILEENARRQKESISSLLERIVTQSFNHAGTSWNEEESALQERLHTAGLAAVGRLKSGRAARSKTVQKDLRRGLRRAR